MGIRPFARWPRPEAAIAPAAIAGKLDRHEQTIRDRLTRMEAAGIIRGYHLFPNLRLFERDIRSIHWAVQTDLDDDTLERLNDVDGVVAVLRFFGPHVCFDLSHGSPTERDRRLRTIGHLLAEPHERLWAHDLAFPNVDRELSTLDWRIIRARRTDARRSATAVADAVGVTAKTVRTRYAAMREEGCIDEYASVDFAAMTEAAPFILYVWFDDGRDPTAALLDRFEAHRLGHFRATEPRSGVFVSQMVASNPAQVHDLVERARAIDGVERAEPQLPTGGYWNEGWIDELVDARGRLSTV